MVARARPVSVRRRPPAAARGGCRTAEPVFASFPNAGTRTNLDWPSSTKRQHSPESGAAQQVGLSQTFMHGELVASGDPGCCRLPRCLVNQVVMRGMPMQPKRSHKRSVCSVRLTGCRGPQKHYYERNLYYVWCRWLQCIVRVRDVRAAHCRGRREGAILCLPAARLQ